VEFEPETMLDRITAATDDLLVTAAFFDDTDVRHPSLLPGWSRGHVLTHIARNADGGTRMLTWARTGIETPEYGSMEARAAEIEAGHGRTAEELLIDGRDSAARFAIAYEAMPAEAWVRVLRWTSGKERPAYRAADARLTEVLVHHVDLRAGFEPADWPDDFVSATISTVVAAYTAREQAPDLRLIASSAGAGHRLDARDDPGRRASVLAWLMGRSDGADLGEELPTLPFLY
jgi:maleylpyruvate isomerase